MARRSLWSISHAVSLRLSPELALQPHRRNPPRVVVIRYAARTTGSAAAWRCGGRSPRSARPGAGSPCIATGAGRRAHTRPGPHSAHTRIRPATARSQILSAGVFGGELALKLGQTLGESWRAHAYTTYRRVLKQPEKQKPTSADDCACTRARRAACPLDLRGLPFGRLEIRPARGLRSSRQTTTASVRGRCSGSSGTEACCHEDELLELVVAHATAILVERHDDCVRRDP